LSRLKAALFPEAPELFSQMIFPAFMALFLARSPKKSKNQIGLASILVLNVLNVGELCNGPYQAKEQLLTASL
jgi:hypothetical protein